MADSSASYLDTGFPELCTDALTRAGVTARDAEQERMLGLSEFLVRMAQRDPVEFQRWLDRRDYEAKLSTRRLDDDLRELALQVDADDQQSLSGAERLALLQQRVRALRYNVQRVVIWRHLSGRASLIETTLALSALADGLLGISVAACTRAVQRVEGDPLDEEGRVQQLVVFGLGKLGGRELNLSSDIDLICAYPAAGKTSGSGKTNQQFFVQVVQRLVKALGEPTGDGFGFRVDLRLRPYGDSGPVVQTFAAMERYFETNGRDWERYALIKARACAGDIAAGEELLERLRPFVYRRYLDFAAIASMRDMRALIRRDADAHKNNVKLGAGGIRDIEFLAQMLQLIWGGRVAALRTSSLAVALDALVVEQLMTAGDRELLWQAYEKFRDTEHALQAFRDEQTHTLPTAAADQLRLAVATGQPDFASLVADLQTTRNAVLGCVGQWLDEDTGATADSAVIDEGFGAAYWRAVVRSVDEGSAAPGLPDGDDGLAVEEVTETIEGRSSQVLRELRQLAARDPEGVVLPRLDALMPCLLDDLRAECSAADSGAPLDETLLHIEPLLKNVLRRSAYLVLLSENENVRQELARLARRGGFFTALLARHPALLEELFLRINLAAVPTLVELRQELATLFPEGTDTALTQQHFDRLAQYKSQHQFRGLLALTRDDLNVMQLADYLTLLAQSVVECVLGWAASEVGADLVAVASEVTGEAVAGEVDAQAPQGFVVIGYGKLGGYELSANSDLDVVFLHNWDSDSHTRLHKLARRVLNYLGMQTYFGELYEVDIRLRPAGRDGMMASTLEGFASYQRNSAWLWEHQALVRARPVAGDAVLAVSFAALRRDILQVPRDRADTCRQIVEMREKMRSNAATAGESVPRSDLKQGVGGIVDIEFMVQYLVLGWAAEFPSLLDFPDNARILEQSSQVGLLPDDVAAQLIADYARLRQAAALAALGSRQQNVDEVRERVAELWQALMVTHRLPARTTRQPEQEDTRNK